MLSTLKKNVHTALIAPSDSFRTEFIRYLFVGGIAFVVDTGLLFIMVHFFGWEYLKAAAISFTMGVITSYILSKTWVFSKSTVKNPYWEFVFFFLIGVGGLLITEVLLFALTSGLGIYYLVSKVVATIIVYFYNFFVRKVLLFR